MARKKLRSTDDVCIRQVIGTCATHVTAYRVLSTWVEYAVSGWGTEENDTYQQMLSLKHTAC